MDTDEKNLENKKVLLIEDEEQFIFAIKSFLEPRGITVFVAKSGQAGLEEISKMKFDLILLDIIMPGMSGFEFLEKLNTSGKIKDLKIVILSNVGQDEDVGKAKKLGVIDYIIKANISLSDLLVRIRKYLV